MHWPSSTVFSPAQPLSKSTNPASNRLSRTSIFDGPEDGGWGGGGGGDAQFSALLAATPTSECRLLLPFSVPGSASWSSCPASSKSSSSCSPVFCDVFLCLEKVNGCCWHKGLIKGMSTEGFMAAVGIRG